MIHAEERSLRAPGYDRARPSPADPRSQGEGEVVGLGMDYDKIVNKRPWPLLKLGPTPLADLRMAIANGTEITSEKPVAFMTLKDHIPPSSSGVRGDTCTRGSHFCLFRLPI